MDHETSAQLLRERQAGYKQLRQFEIEEARRATFVERITDFDPPNALSYDIEGLPRLVRHLRSSWTLRPLARGYTEVTLTSTVDIGSNPVQKLAERIFGRVSAKQLDLLFSGLTKRVEGSHV